MHKAPTTKPKNVLACNLNFVDSERNQLLTLDKGGPKASQQLSQFQSMCLLILFPFISNNKSTKCKGKR